MKKLAILLMKAPYGDINAAEAVRHALGAVAGDIDVSLVLADRGILLATKGQDEGDTGFTNLGESLKDCIDMGVDVYAEKASLRQERLEEADLIEGVNVIAGSEVSDIVGEADKTMIF